MRANVVSCRELVPSRMGKAQSGRAIKRNTNTVVKTTKNWYGKPDTDSIFAYFLMQLSTWKKTRKLQFDVFENSFSSLGSIFWRHYRTRIYDVAMTNGSNLIDIMKLIKSQPSYLLNILPTLVLDLVDMFCK